MSNQVQSIDFNDASQRVGKPRIREAIDQAVRQQAVSDQSPSGPEHRRPHFLLNDEGVFHVGVTEEGDLSEPQFVCSPLQVEAKTRNRQSEEWGRLLTWQDADGRMHRWAAPAELLFGDPREFARALAAGGVEISPGRNALSRLLTYIIQARTDARARSVAAPGWHDTRYVLPSGDVYGAGSELFVYQHAGGLSHHCAEAGTLADWKREVARRCVGNSRLLLAVSAMFAGPLLHFTGATGGGFHLVGGSSSGKTTALRVAASVLGPPEYVREWRSTANGLEGVAVLHNDATLILDELAQIDPRQAGDAAYLLANGSGKSRANRAGEARAAARWKLLILSAGEIGLSQHMAEAGRLTRAGQSVRLADVPADVDSGFGVFETLHDAVDGASLSAVLKTAAARAFGTPWPLWLDYLANAEVPRLTARSRADCDAFLREHVPPGATGEVVRVAERFALVAAAGEIATACQHKLTGWSKGEATAGALTCFKAWLVQRGGHGSADATALRSQVRAFFEAHGDSRLEELSGSPRPVPIRDRVGFRRRNALGLVEYLVLTEAFRRDVCAGHDPRRAARTLIEAEWLKPDKANKAAQAIRIPELGLVRAYVFDAQAVHEGRH